MEKFRARQIKALGLSYRKGPSKPKLIRMMREADVPEAEPLIRTFEGCTRYRPCRLCTCPTCGPKLKARAKDAALDRIVCRLGRFPTPEEVSFVTIHGPRIDLDPDIAQEAMLGFKEQLRRLGKRPGKETSWLGFMDVSAGGLIHWHGIILHSSTPRSRLEALLESSFSEKDQVTISQWNRSQSLAEAMQAVVNYSIVAERHVKVFVRADGPDRVVELIHDPKAITRRIIVVQALAGRVIQGLRFAMNMKPTIRGRRVSELETLRRSTKRSRNNKTMLNRPWAPRGTVGTHLVDDLGDVEKGLLVGSNWDPLVTKNGKRGGMGKVSIQSGSDAGFSANPGMVTGRRREGENEAEAKVTDQIKQ
jgi:hypothetical protein